MANANKNYKSTTVVVAVAAGEEHNEKKRPEVLKLQMMSVACQIMVLSWFMKFSICADQKEGGVVFLL